VLKSQDEDACVIKKFAKIMYTLKTTIQGTVQVTGFLHSGQIEGGLGKSINVTTNILCNPECKLTIDMICMEQESHAASLFLLLSRRHRG